MIKWDMRNGDPALVQTSTQPLIYLDQWMWGLLSEDERLRERFVSIVQQKKGTIIYPLMNFLEFTKISDPGQIEAIKTIMDSTEFGFARSDPQGVVDDETKLETPAGGAFYDRHPIVDRDLLKLLGYAVDPLKPVRVSALLDSITCNE